MEPAGHDLVQDPDEAGVFHLHKSHSLIGWHGEPVHGCCLQVLLVWCSSCNGVAAGFIGTLNCLKDTQLTQVKAVGRCRLPLDCHATRAHAARRYSAPRQLSCPVSSHNSAPPLSMIIVGPPTVQRKLQTHPRAVLGATIGIVAWCLTLLVVGLVHLACSCRRVNRDGKYWSKRRRRCTALVGVFTTLEVGWTHVPVRVMWACGLPCPAAWQSVTGAPAQQSGELHGAVPGHCAHACWRVDFCCEVVLVQGLPQVPVLASLGGEYTDHGQTCTSGSPWDQTLHVGLLRVPTLVDLLLDPTFVWASTLQLNGVCGLCASGQWLTG